jgi:hypothetical protein
MIFHVGKMDTSGAAILLAMIPEFIFHPLVAWSRLLAWRCKQARKARRRQLRVECLEDRCLLSTAASAMPNMMILQQAALAGNAGGAGVTSAPVTLAGGSASSAPASLDFLSLWLGAVGTGLAPTPAPAASATAPPPSTASSPPASFALMLTGDSWNPTGAAATPAVSVPAPISSPPNLGVFFTSQVPSNPVQALSPDLSPWTLDNGWLSDPFYSTLPPAIQPGMFFNNDASYGTYVSYFYGYARSWAAEASALGITDDGQLQAFFAEKLNAEFQATRGVLAAAYPGLSDTQYRLLMSMNLAAGYYIFGTPDSIPTNFGSLVNSQIGCCTEIAQLTASFAHLQGISAQVISFTTTLPTALGDFGGAHTFVSAGGMWLDAQSNIAFNFDPIAIQALPAYQRLTSLLNSGNVYGFYNWYLNPSIRNEQLQRGLDGGTVAFAWYYYLAALGSGTTVYGPWDLWLPPLNGS